MGIKPALGWLALLLFTTTAQAEGAREIFKSPKAADAKSAAAATKLAQVSERRVTPKTKAPPAPPVVANVSHHVAPKAHAPLKVIESTGAPRSDYELRGTLDFVFAAKRETGIHLDRDRIQRLVRMAPEERSLATIGHTVSARKAGPATTIDVIDTDDTIYVVDASASAVYVFARKSTLDQRVAALGVLPAPTRDRIREALVIAEWTPIKSK